MKRGENEALNCLQSVSPSRWPAIPQSMGLWYNAASKLSQCVQGEPFAPLHVHTNAPDSGGTLSALRVQCNYLGVWRPML